MASNRLIESAEQYIAIAKHAAMDARLKCETRKINPVHIKDHINNMTSLGDSLQDYWNRVDAAGDNITVEIKKWKMMADKTDELKDKHKDNNDLYQGFVDMVKRQHDTVEDLKKEFAATEEMLLKLESTKRMVIKCGADLLTLLNE